MKRKELKNFAEKIAELEYKRQQSQDKAEQENFENQIMALTNQMVTRGLRVPNELLEVDCLVQEILTTKILDLKLKNNLTS